VLFIYLFASTGFSRPGRRIYQARAHRGTESLLAIHRIY
jgi:hypothetical protein